MEPSQSSRDCPGENTLVEILERQLTVDELSRVGHHIDDCPRCRELLALMARSSVVKTKLGKRLRFARGTEPPSPGERSPFLARGTHIGRYRVEKLLGKGGMGLVYEAFDPELDRRVALKLIRPELDKLGPAIEARLVREAKAQARVSHPNVVAVYDVGAVGDQVFVAMEHVDGVTLSEWLRAEHRAPAEILRVFVAAGRGLQAAHEAGLVHRDFKPDNVLIEADGRVRVADFGLARSAGDPDPSRPPSPLPPSVPVTSTLTCTGAVVGTPAYMAPEQHQRRPTDARSDEFSFCVALYEALYGRRPFAGDTPTEVANAVLNGALVRPPKGGGVPGRVRRAVLRGLRKRPQDRYPSMRALLRAIAPRRRGALRLAAAAGAAAAIAVGVYAAVFAGSPDRDPCDAAGDLAGTWDAPRKLSVRAALLAPATNGRWAYVEDQLDRYAGKLAAMREDSCRATRDNQQSAEVADLRVHCLEARVATLQAVTGLLDAPDPAVAEGGIESIARLPRIEACSRAEVIEARVPQPTDAKTRAAVDELRRELARADALRLAGQYKEAVARLEPLAERAASLGYRPIEAEVLYHLGAASSPIVEPHAVEEILQRAANAAEAGRHDEMAFEAWSFLVIVASQDLGDAEKAHFYADRARAALERFGDHPELESRLNLHLGSVYLEETKLDEALASFRSAAELQVDTGDEDVVLAAMEGTSMVYETQGKFEEALEAQTYVLNRRIETLGADHPDVALARNNMAAVLMQLGRVDEALEHMQEALRITEAVQTDSSSAETAKAQFNVAEILAHLGRYDEALDLHTRALAAFERVHGADSGMVAVALVTQGELMVRMERADEAVAISRRALTIMEREMPDDHFELARCLVNLGDALRERGDYDEALAIAERGRDALAAAVGEDSPYMGYALTGVGRTLLDSGAPAKAVRPLQRAVELYEQAGVDPTELAVTRFALARALAESGRDTDRAAALAARARAVFEEAGPGRARELRQVDSWLAK